MAKIKSTHAKERDQRAEIVGHISEMTTGLAEKDRVAPFNIPGEPDYVVYGTSDRMLHSIARAFNGGYRREANVSKMELECSASFQIDASDTGMLATAEDRERAYNSLPNILAGDLVNESGRYGAHIANLAGNDKDKQQAIRDIVSSKIEAFEEQFNTAESYADKNQVLNQMVEFYDLTRDREALRDFVVNARPDVIPIKSPSSVDWSDVFDTIEKHNEAVRNEQAPTDDAEDIVEPSKKP
jgi:hypothetical protein